ISRMSRHLYSYIGSLPKSTSHLNSLNQLFYLSNVSYDFFTTSGLPCTWVVPANAKIVSAQNTGKIIVNWESSSGDHARGGANLSFNADVEYRYTIEITDRSGKIMGKSGIAK